MIRRISMIKQGLKQLLIPGMLFEDMGITYLGPVDGHDVKQLSRVLNEAKRLDHAVLVHDQEGKGLCTCREESFGIPWGESV